MGAYADLTVPDPRTGRFTPGGLSLGRVLTADSTVEFQRSLIADATLVEVVPERVSQEFGRLHTLHLHGVTRYENFTDVCNLAPGLYETALQARFLEFYRGREIPFLGRTGASLPLPAPSGEDFRPVFEHVKMTKGSLLQTSSGGTFWFNGMLFGLFAWARAEGLLRGQRARVFEKYVLWARNEISHGRRFQLEMPVQSVEEIRDLAQFINQLWGVPTPGGRRYPAAVERQVLAIGLNDQGETINFPARELAGFRDADAWQWLLVRSAHPYGGFIEFDLRFAVSDIPTQYLFGPGTAEEASAWINAHQPGNDRVDIVDQLLLVRKDRRVLYAPQYPEVALGLPREQQTGDWYLMLADSPAAAWGCIRSRMTGRADHNNCSCLIEVLAHGSWRKMLHHLGARRPELFAALTPHPRPAQTQLPPDIHCAGFATLQRRREVPAH